MQHASEYLPSEILRHAARLASITAMLQSILPGDLALHVWYVGVKEQTVRLLTDNGCWVASLRFQQQMLLEQINALSGHPPCTKITVQVVPEGLSPPPRRNSPSNT